MRPVAPSAREETAKNAPPTRVREGLGGRSLHPQQSQHSIHHFSSLFIIVFIIFPTAGAVKPWHFSSFFIIFHHVSIGYHSTRRPPSARAFLRVRYCPESALRRRATFVGASRARSLARARANCRSGARLNARGRSGAICVQWRKRPRTITCSSGRVISGRARARARPSLGPCAVARARTSAFECGPNAWRDRFRRKLRRPRSPQPRKTKRT